MIDAHFQRRGIGRLALQLAIEQLQTVTGVTIIELCYNPNNPLARSFYASLGFTENGLDADGDDMLAEIRL